MRFIEDFIPAITLLAVLVFGRVLLYITKKVFPIDIWIVSMGLAVYTMVIGTLLGVSSYSDRFHYMHHKPVQCLIQIFCPLMVGYKVASKSDALDETRRVQFPFEQISKISLHQAFRLRLDFAAGRARDASA